MEDNNNLLNEEENYEPGFFDKLVGVFTEPGTTFGDLVKVDAKFADWFLPVMLVVILSVSSQFIIRLNPVLKQKTTDIAMEEVRKSLQEQVDAGNISEEQAEAQMEQIRPFVEKGNPFTMAIQGIVGLVIGVIIFFLFLAIMFFILKLLFKGDGTFGHAMSVYGLSYYIAFLHSVIVIIAMFATDNIMTGVSPAEFLDLDKLTITGWLVSKLDPFRIWFWVVVGIGFAKVFQSKETVKYIIATILLWLAGSFAFWLIAQQFSSFKYYL